MNRSIAIVVATLGFCAAVFADDQSPESKELRAFRLITGIAARDIEVETRADWLVEAIELDPALSKMYPVIKDILRDQPRLHELAADRIFVLAQKYKHPNLVVLAITLPPLSTITEERVDALVADAVDSFFDPAQLPDSQLDSWDALWRRRVDVYLKERQFDEGDAAIQKKLVEITSPELEVVRQTACKFYKTASIWPELSVERRSFFAGRLRETIDRLPPPGTKEIQSIAFVYYRAFCYFFADRPEQFLNLLYANRAVVSNPAATNKLIFLALSSLHRHEEALAQGREMIRDEPEDIGFLLRFASTMANNGEIEVARESLNAILKKFPTNAKVPAILSGILIDSGRFEEAEAEIVKVKDPIEADLLRSRLAVRRGDGAAAMNILKRMEARRPTSQIYLNMLNVACRKQDVAAILDCKDRMRICNIPWTDDEANALAWALAESNIDLDGALKWATFAVDFDPRNPFYHATLATVYWRRNEFGPAADHIQKAVATAPPKNRGVILSRAGDIMLASGDRNAAKERYEQALALSATQNPDLDYAGLREKVDRIK